MNEVKSFTKIIPSQQCEFLIKKVLGKIAKHAAGRKEKGDQQSMLNLA